MKASQRSRTADSSAAMRAAHHLHGAKPKIFEDPFALDLTTPGWRWLVRNKLRFRFIDRVIFPWARPILAEHLARSRYAEARLDAALQRGTRQYLLLGAGLDSFALRRPDLADSVQIFEVDHPATQQAKRERFRQLGIEAPKNVTYVPVDFERSSLREALTRSSLSPTLPAFVSWLGTTAYLTKDAFSCTLEALASMLAGSSEIVFDCLDEKTFQPGARTPSVRKALRFAARRGEPMITGFDPEELAADLEKLRFRVLEMVTPEEQRRRYFADRSDGLEPAEQAYFVAAEVV